MNVFELRNFVTSEYRRFSTGYSTIKAKDIKTLGYTGEPFGWDEVRRLQLRCELDAYYAHLYDLTRDKLRYILDSSRYDG